MPERLPYGLLTYDAFQDEYIDESYTATFATPAEAAFEAEHLVEALQPGIPGGHLETTDPTDHIYIVGPDGNRDFCRRV